MATPIRLSRLFVALPLVGVFAAFGASLPVLAQETPFNLAADEVVYTGDTSSSVIEARGNVTVAGPQGNLTADKLVYDPATDVMTASGNVVLVDPSGTTLAVDTL